jgi:protein-S-isoprenylcysteine O-methyltransferase Ste14
VNAITVVRKLVRWVLGTLLIAVSVLLPAGRIDVPMLWACIAVYSGAALALVFAMDPDLARERRRPGPGGLDQSLRRVAGPLMIGSVVLASCDVGRFHWSDTVPLPLQVGALAIFALGVALAVWAMAVNRFFSPVVRIQKERGHHLITTGPYRSVRHPGYTGMFFGGLASPLAMGSWWALVPAAAYALMVLRRTIIEDRFLTESLDGYKAFSGQVKYRLVPGLW